MAIGNEEEAVRGVVNRLVQRGSIREGGDEGIIGDSVSSEVFIRGGILQR